MFLGIFCYEVHLVPGSNKIAEGAVEKLNALLYVILQLINNTPGMRMEEKLLTAVANCLLISVDQEWISACCKFSFSHQLP